jgi:hypothetical protein
MSEEKRTSTAEHPNAALLLNVTKGFDYLFSDDIASAKKHFEPHNDPLHLLGLGVCTFLEAALAMEVLIGSHAYQHLDSLLTSLGYWQKHLGVSLSQRQVHARS